MKLSTKGRYGLRALIDLAVHADEGAVSIQSIAERQNISESYLEQLARLLKKANVFQWHGCRRSPPERCHATLWVVERHNHRGLHPHGDVHGQLPVQLEQQQRD